MTLGGLLFTGRVDFPIYSGRKIEYVMQLFDVGALGAFFVGCDGDDGARLLGIA